MAFMHVSNSATLVGLKRSNYSLVCLTDLLLKYSYAPMAGEVFLGGTRGPLTNTGVSFADIKGTYWEPKSLLRNYGANRSKTYYPSSVSLEEDIKNLVKYNFTSLTSVIVKLMRTIQNGDPLPLNDEQRARLIGAIDLGCKKIQRLYLRNFILPVYFRFGKRGIKPYEIQSAFMNYLLDVIPLNFLELPEEQKQTFIAKFEDYFAETRKQCSYAFLPDEEYEFTDYFLKFNPEDKLKELDIDEYSLDTAFMEPDRKDFLNSYMDRKPNEELHSYSLDEEKLSSKIKNACNTLSQRVEFLKQLLNGNGAKEMSSEEKDICVHSFPIVFILEDNTKLEQVRYEYRSLSELKLGSDILRMATESEHIPKLKSFLSEANLNSVKVISISDLLGDSITPSFFKDNSVSDGFNSPKFSANDGCAKFC